MKAKEELQKTANDKNGSVDKTIQSAIHEYLLKYGYHSTLDEFQKETSKSAKQKQISEEEIMQDCLDKLTRGEKDKFFVLWNRAIPAVVKESSEELKKLEFFIQVYFAIYTELPSVPPTKTTLKQRMAEFKQFIESIEVETSKTTDFLAFYALPHFANPKEHPSCKHLFTAKWIKELKDKVAKALTESVESNSVKLVEMFKGRVEKVQIMSKEVEGKGYLELKKEYAALKKKEEVIKNTLVACQKKWNNFALDLLNMAREV